MEKQDHFNRLLQSVPSGGVGYAVPDNHVTVDADPVPELRGHVAKFAVLPVSV